MLTSASAGEDAARPDVSVVVTVFNEARNVDELVERLSRALIAWGRPWEVVLVDDGSRTARERCCAPPTPVMRAFVSCC